MEDFKNIVVGAGEVSESDYAKAEELSKQKNILIVHALERLKIGNADKILSLYGRFHKIRLADLDAKDIPPNIIALVPRDLAKKSKVVPIDRFGNNIIIATLRPQDLGLLDLIRFKTGYTPKPVIASEASLEAALKKYYELKIDIKDLEANSVGMAQKQGAVPTDGRTLISEEATGPDSPPIIKLVDQILMQTLARGASDVHFEPYESYMRVRLRIDGVLHELIRPPANIKPQLLSRIKIMAGLDIAERRLPQDGAIQAMIAGRPIDFRVSSLPTMHGEKIVLRMLDKSALNVDMEKLGFEPDDLDRFNAMIKKPFGIVLVTGPTGSGKTTTLYSALSELNKVTENIMTAEDPVEYNLEGINQVQVNSSIGLEFSAALRSFLRQDPDIIMVGEIRDRETGEIAIKASLTGHLVLSTLHTNSAADTIVRLQNMGLESFNIVASINGVVAQRLVRKLCQKCKVLDDQVTPAVLQELGIPKEYASRYKSYKGSGCSACNGTGYKGRSAIHEVLTMTDLLREAIMDGAHALALKKIAMKKGMRSLRQNALRKLVAGLTDVHEVIKVTTSDETE